MLGAVFGDIVGSSYEWHNVKTKDFPLERPGTCYTDDSVMTLAVAKWLLEDPSHSESHLIKCMQKLGRGHFKAGYGGRFREWLQSKDPQPYNSWGNGSAMRVSPVALYANSLEEALELAQTTAKVTHNHSEGLKGALAVAECVFISREAADVDEAKREIRDSISRKYGYNLERTLDEIRPEYKFDVSCQGSVPEAIIAFLESNSLEDCVRNAISIGGDSDTIAAIACSIYAAKNNQEDDTLAKRFEHYLPADLLRIMEAFEKRIRNRRPIENSYRVTNQIFAGEYPRNKDQESSIVKLQQFESFGTTHFVDLTEEGELEPYDKMLYSGASYLRFPIRDRSVPKSMDEVRKLVKRIIKIVNNNSEAKVYIHCWGGVGRTGLIVGCLLGELCELSYDETMAKLEQLFLACPKSAKRETPETAEQREFIAKFVREKPSGRKTSISGNTEQRKDIKRFLEAQNANGYGYKQALEEVKNGRKVNHWIWFVFPQMKGLGQSRMSEFYGIEDWDEAEDFLLNYTLNDRIHEISNALLQHEGTPVNKIFGGIDALKVRSSMTLFDALSPNDVFAKVLDAFFDGEKDERTLKLLEIDME